MTDEQATTQNTDLVIPATQSESKDVGTLSLRYVDGVPVLVVSGGNVVPARLAVLDASGKPVGLYTAGQLGATPQARDLLEGNDENEMGSPRNLGVTQRSSAFHPGDYTGVVAMTFDAVPPAPRALNFTLSVPSIAAVSPAVPESTSVGVARPEWDEDE